MPEKGPKPACVEEWDSDESCAKPATEVQAKQSSSTARRHEQQKTPSRTPKQAQPTSRREPASDSGYSSQNSAARAKGAPPPLSIPTTNATRQPASTPMSPAKPNTKKPVIHRVDSARSRSQTVVQQASDKCDDPNCRDVNCPSSRNKERRKTINYSQAQPPPSPSQAYTYAQAPQYQYSRDMPPPPLPLQRTNSRSSRPQSFHAGMPMLYQGAQPGPPPAQSAYYSYAQGYGQSPVYGATAQGQYVPASPITTIPPSPTSPNASGYPGYPGGTISARIPNPNVAGIEAPKLAPHPGQAMRTSARRPDNRALPGAYPDDGETSDSSVSSSEYDSEEERYQRRREFEAKQRRRLSYVEPRSKSRPRDKSRGRDDPIAMITQSSHARRPSMSKSYHTDSYVPTRRHSVRDPRTERLQRAPYSDNGFDYPSSDNFDSDRTARAVISTRSAPSSKQHSRRQSVSTNASTNASSGGTKATTLSSNSEYSHAIIEDSRGRRVVYLSKEQQAELLRQHQLQKRRDSIDERDRLASLQYNAASAYQKKMSGGIDGYEMSAENIKNLNRKSTSHSHSGRSQKSAGSGSKVSRSNAGVKIHAGGTVLHVDGDMAMQVRTTEDGEVHLVLGQNGREIEYNNSSKGSSRSRISRGRGRDRIPEAVDEGGYEKPL